ncbi:MAG: hypothetical protein ACU0BF_11885 [Paracoccaceae bacterium]
MADDQTPEVAPAPDAAEAVATPPPRIEFARPADRMKVVQLEYPLTVDGAAVDAVIVRRLNGAQVTALLDALQAGGMTDNGMVAALTDQDVAVIDALDADDLAVLREAVFDFLPRTVRQGIEAVAREASLPGEALSPTSPPSSAGPSTTS